MMDWQLLGAALATHLQLPLRKIQAQPLSGGDISQAYRLELGRHRFFVKLNRVENLPMFVSEQAGLDVIRASGTIRVPEVFMTGQESGQAFIIMEHLELCGRAEPERLAAALAAMHGVFHERFGFHCDNNIGSTPQINQFCDDWIEFWRRYRLGFQLELAARGDGNARLIDTGQRLLGNLECFFDGHQPRPSLLHGDLWSGNQAADATGNPIIYDPACYFGDHEAELAMLELFASPGERFFTAYTERLPIDAGYARRRELYNLYHILNHANLFGGGYWSQAQRMIDSLLTA
jgi:protein-ribulosamine 3-kinase